jgi:hypothetical protein
VSRSIIERTASPAFAGAAFLHHGGGEGHGGLKLAKFSGQCRPIQLAQGFETQPAVRANHDLDLIAFTQAGLSKAISRKLNSQAVAPAADPLLKMLACIRGYALRPGMGHAAKEL